MTPTTHRRIGENQGTTEKRKHALRIIAERGPIKYRDLADLLGYKGGARSASVKRLLEPVAYRLITEGLHGTHGQTVALKAPEAKPEPAAKFTGQEEGSIVRAALKAYAQDKSVSEDVRGRAALLYLNWGGE